MPTQDSLIHVGIADFSPRALLLIGDQQSLTWLAQEIAQKRLVRLKDHPTRARMAGIADLEIVPNSDRSSLRVDSDHHVTWTIARTDAAGYSEQLVALAKAEQPAHTYLDPTNGSDLELIASKGEYDPAKLFGK
jgi:hypothetical protein